MTRKRARKILMAIGTSRNREMFGGPEVNGVFCAKWKDVPSFIVAHAEFVEDIVAYRANGAQVQEPLALASSFFDIFFCFSLIFFRRIVFPDLLVVFQQLEGV